MDFKNIFVYLFTLLTVLTGIRGFSFVKICDKRRGLSDEQVTMCYQYRNTFIPLVIRAQQLAMETCRLQFAGRRWNCTFKDNGDVPHLIKPPMKLATKEKAYVSALSSAAIMNGVSRACYENKLKDYCGCSQESRPKDLPVDDIWGGCGDNLQYGYEFSKKFVDASEKKDEKDPNALSKAIMNLHNNEAGRLAVFDKSIVQCRCYGNTKNCATKTCYRQLGHFRDVGSHLEELHQSSIPVELRKISDNDERTRISVNSDAKLVAKSKFFSTNLKFTSKDLLYLQESPSYCEENNELSIFGIKGRKCVKDGRSLNDCSILCCGKGHFTRREIIKEECGCQYIDGSVDCKICEKEENVRYCK